MLDFKKRYVCYDYDIINFIEEISNLNQNTICKMMVEEGLYADDGAGSITLCLDSLDEYKENDYTITYYVLTEIFNEKIEELEIISG